ncbi:EF-hand domain-containing protein [Sandaracinobacteroides hominis]|uniref:EF-hand domain-containing protein n=1 Tax=Sandaracinobacteroides hominis TaxID=2780086 RepID=UPI0018F4946B|nr:EF-hand domain-containing protein [Sandaracinobacteroides hominis]
MDRKLFGRLAALSSAGLLAAGGVALWFSADVQRAEAGRIPVAEAAAPAEESEPELVAPEPTRPKTREEQRFARADRDDDGRITQAEYLTQRRRNFDKLDLNGDGKLSFEEYAASGIEKFRKADANGDGLLLAAEFATTAPKVKKIQTASAEKCACSPTQTAAASDD